MIAVGKVLAIAAIVEVGTGIVLLLDPSIVAHLLLGATISGVAVVLARCFGIALLGLGIACWPGRQHAGTHSMTFAGMLVYNVLIASYLAYLGTAAQMAGLLLWPAVALHALVALGLVWTKAQTRGR